MSVLLLGKMLGVCSAWCGFGDLVLASIRPQGLGDSCPLDAGTVQQKHRGEESRSPVSPVVCVSLLSAGAKLGHTLST